MSTRLNTTVCLTALITTMGFVQAGNAAGDDGGDGDDGLRIALLQAGGSGTVSYDVTELKDGSRVNALTVTDGCMMMMGLEASDDLQVIGLEIGGDASISLHALGTDSSEDDFYEAGTHTVTLAAGGTQLVGAPNDGTISILWSEPPPVERTSSGSDIYVGLGDFTILGGSVSYHPSQDQDWLWFHGPALLEAASSVQIQAIGGDTEASMVWVGDVTSGSSFTLPGEGSDESGVTLTEGDHDVTIGPGGLFAVRLGNPDSDDDGGGGDEGGCAADLNGDGEVNGADLATLLSAWGVCSGG